MPTAASCGPSRSRSTPPTPFGRSTPTRTTCGRSGPTSSSGRPSSRCWKRRASTSTNWRPPPGTPDADPFDLLCHLAYNAPLLTRKQRAEKLRKEKKDFFDQFGPEARAIINELLDKYAEHGTAQFTIPDVFEVPPISATRQPEGDRRPSSAGRTSWLRRSASCRNTSTRRKSP